MVELTDQLIPGCDPDLVKPLHKHVEERYEAIMLSTKVASRRGGQGRDQGRRSRATTRRMAQTYDRVLVAVGRRANGDQLDLDKAGVSVDDRGEIPWTPSAARTSRTSTRSATSPAAPMLAHKASHEGKVAAEVIAGHDVVFEPLAIPSVAYTDPEVAWTGLTETEAMEHGHRLREGDLPLAGVGPRPRPGRARGSDEAPDRSGVPAGARRRHRRAQRGRPDRRGDARDRDGRRRRGHRASRSTRTRRSRRR